MRTLICILLTFVVSSSPAADFGKVEVPGLPPMASASPRAIAWGDYDNDNQLDFITTGSLITQLWRNTGSGFVRVPVSGLNGVSEGSVAWGDYNNDGRLDFLITGTIIVGNTVSQICQVWRNTGTRFVQVLVPGLSGVRASDAAWADYNNDGRLDFMISGTRSIADGPRVTQLWRNTGTSFVQVPIPGLVGLENSCIAWGDYDQDGWNDFLIMGTTNSMFATSGPSAEEAAVTQLWRNTGTGFSLVQIPGLPRDYLGKVAWGDYDNDGWLDFMIGPVGQIWRNTSTGFTRLPGQYGLALDWVDYDNDGWLDLCASANTLQLWRNTGGNFELDPFVNSSAPSPFSIAWADYDRDSRQDFLLTGFDGSLEGSQYFSELWQNLGPATNSPPSEPTGIRVDTSAGVTTISWSPATDDHTPLAGLSYNLRIGTQPGREDILSSHSDLLSGFRRLPAPGNAGARTNFQMRLPRGNYFASVQAVDSAMAGGPFAAEIAFSTLPTLSVVRQGEQLVVSWTEPESGYVLESSTSLEPASWQPVPAGSNSPVLVNASETQRFFRLRKP
jgi:hypothetical protein